MQYSFALFTLLSTATALSDIESKAYGYHGANSTSLFESTTGTSTSGNVVSLYSVSPSSKARPYPTGEALWYPHAIGEIWSRPHPIGTDGSAHHQPSNSSTATAPISYTTTITTIPITTTITTHVPCSTKVSSNGQAWWTTYLTTSYRITAYTTTKTNVALIPTTTPDLGHNDCPAHATVTETVTQSIGLPSSPPPENPSHELTTKTLTLTLDHDRTTTIAVSYTIPTTTRTHFLHGPPYPSQSHTFSFDARSTGGCSHNYQHPSSSETSKPILGGYGPPSRMGVSTGRLAYN